jgi:hypothetical protein
MPNRAGLNTKARPYNGNGDRDGKDRVQERAGPNGRPAPAAGLTSATGLIRGTFGGVWVN